MFTKNIFTNKDGIADLVGNILEADYKNKVEELKGNQHKIDANKNNKIDAQDFKILRGEKGAQKEEIDPTDTTTDTLRGREKTSKNPNLSKKVMMDVPGNVKEEAEQIDELSYDTLNSYMRKKRKVIAKVGDMERHRGTPKGKKMEKDVENYRKAWQKRDMKEEAEQVDEEQLNELSPDTLNSYMKAAKKDINKNRPSMNAAPGSKRLFNINKRVSGYRKAWAKRDDKESSQANTNSMNVRKEETEQEQIDEISKATLTSYATKARAHGEKLSREGEAAMKRTSPKSLNTAYQKFKKATLRHLGASTAERKASMKREDVEQVDEEQLDELKKSTLVRYATKANKSSIDLGVKASRARDNDDMETWAKNRNKAEKRDKGIQKAMGKIRKEEVEELEERNKENATRRKTMDASRGARFKAQGYYTPDPKPEHKTTQAHDKAVGRAIRQMSREEVEQIDERELSKGETAEKERIVKGMKKSLSGFKARYGDKAKSVMYATATKAAKKD